MPDRSALIGQWSAYDYDGYGTMEDEVVTFLADGTGWYAFERGVLCERETFRWSLADDGQLTCGGLMYAALGEDGASVSERPSARVMQCRISVAGATPRWPGAQPVPVLTCDPAPFAGATTYALRTARPAAGDLPRFPGEREDGSCSLPLVARQPAR